MSGDSDLLAPVSETPAPAQDAAPPVVPPADDEPEVLEIPTGEKLVPLSALESARAKVRDVRAELENAKAEAGKSSEREARIQELQAQLQALQPKAQAYDAAIEAQARQPQPPAEPTPQQTAKLEKIARQLDFYKSDGTLDIARAKDHLELVREEAAEIAREQVAPYEQMTISQQSGFMLERALITKAPDGSQPDPEVLREVWNRLDKRLTASAQGAAQAFSVALGHSALMGKMRGAKAAAKEEIPPPLEVERAGGKEGGPVTLRDSDRRIARDIGLTDKQYAEQLAEMPAGWGKG